MATRQRRGSSKKSSRSSERTSTRRAASGGKAATAGKKRKAVPAGFRGKAGQAKLKEELERQKQKKADRENQTNQPFRLRLSAGDTKEIIVLDDIEEELFFQYEHNLQNPRSGYWDIFTGCTKETENCPVCEDQDKESYYALYLTVIDLTEFTDRRGNVHEFSRKLMPVKSGQIGKFLRRQEREGTLRGALFELARDGDRDPQIGNDIEFIEMVPEEDLETYTREWTDKDNKVHEEDCSEVYDYEELFPAPTEEMLLEAIGGSSSSGGGSGKSGGAGSRRQAREELDNDDAEEDENEWEPEDDDTQYGEEEAENEEPDEEGEEEVGEEAEEEEPSRRSRRSRPASGGRKSSRASTRGGKAGGKAAPKSRAAGRGSRRSRK